MTEGPDTRHPRDRLPMKRLALLGLLAGVALLTALVVWQGVRPVMQSIDRAGWGVFWLVAFYVAPLVLAAESWRLLFPRGRGPGLGAGLGLTWIGLAVNWLLPVGQVGGELVKARLMVRRGGAAGLTLASVMADKTLQLATLVPYSLLGLLLIIAYRAEANLILAVAGGIVICVALVLAFYRAQRRGLFGIMARLGERLLAGAQRTGVRAGALEIDEAVRATYQRRSRLLGAASLRLAFRLTLCGEIMIGQWLLGYPVSFIDALILESLAQVVRAGAFLIPGGLGAQEGAIVLLGPAVGLPGEAALAIALFKRVRELGVGLPALLVWQMREGRWAWSTNVGADSHAAGSVGKGEEATTTRR